MALGFLAAILLGTRMAERQGISVNRMLDLFFWMLASSVLGSRLLYVVVNSDDFARICAGPPGVDPRSTGRQIFTTAPARCTSGRGASSTSAGWWPRWP